MTEDIEEQFRAACTDYLAAAEHVDQERARTETAQARLRDAEQAADWARDQLLQVVRERAAAAQLDAGGGRVRPSDRARGAEAAWTVRSMAGTIRPDDTDYWKEHNGICAECGVPWRIISPDCPHQIVDWHPKRAEDSAQMP